ncbi:hypothetical protein ACJX0J_040104 [Zea mays]
MDYLTCTTLFMEQRHAARPRGIRPEGAKPQMKRPFDNMFLVIMLNNLLTMFWVFFCIIFALHLIIIKYVQHERSSPLIVLLPLAVVVTTKRGGMLYEAHITHFTHIY